jgi:hypothetical protein
MGTITDPGLMGLRPLGRKIEVEEPFFAEASFPPTVPVGSLLEDPELGNGCAFARYKPTGTRRIDPFHVPF